MFLSWCTYYIVLLFYVVATVSLAIQNGLLCLSSIAMALMFYYEWNVCLNVAVFSILTVVVIILASGANLATVANTISIEKDWIVVIADENKDTLAGNYIIIRAKFIST